jgi:sec-independent protein translocase protein TatA
MGGIGFKEILILALIIIILFGAKKIPELMRGMGSGIKEFKDAVKEDDKKPAEPKQNSDPSL